MNRLTDEASPYLRQHAENPVDWFAWGPQAFATAEEAGKPILLSVGYSACHWCHVMAHESFEDSATAAVMNDLFVNIKVDREERPDVDAIYMEAVQAITGRGGWPMTVFMTPTGEPFYGGTYFPKTSSTGHPSFVDVLHRVRQAWDDNRDDVVAQARELTASIGRSATMASAPDLPPIDVLDRAEADLRARFDPQWGGFGEPPKFPQTMALELLLRRQAEAPTSEREAMLSVTLDAMASGGIYDHLGGGFARYSTDATWTVPHFEKMLYDNALLARVYLHAWQVTANDNYLQVVDETIAYVLTELRHVDGGLYSAEDADSEGEEGRYYVWTPKQISAVLGDDAPEFSSWFGVSASGNFEGKNILTRPPRGDLRRPASVELSRVRLQSSREMRIRPGLDDKVLTEWNAMMLATLAEAAKVTAHQQWLEASIRNAEFLLRSLRRPDGRWLRSWQRADGDRGAGARHLAYASDIANVVDAFTRLAEASGEARWIGHASDAADQLLSLFWDDVHGGFFSTGSDAEALITRPKDLTDGAVSSANSVAAVALLRLAALTGNRTYAERGRAIVQWLGNVAAEHPTAVAHALYALELIHNGTTEIVIPGDQDELLDTVRPRFMPYAVLAWGEPYDSPLWEGRTPGHAYVCQDFACNLPAETPEALAEQLG